MIIEAVQVSLNFILLRNSVPFRSVRASELALPRDPEGLGISTFFQGLTETVLSLFRGIFSEQNSVPTLGGTVEISFQLWVYFDEPATSSNRESKKRV